MADPLPPPSFDPGKPKGGARSWIKAVLVVGAIVAVVAGINQYQQDQADKKVAQATKVFTDALNADEGAPVATHRVTYKTAGTAPYGSITYQTASGTAQQSDVDIPLTPKGGAKGAGISFTMNDGDFVYLSIQNSTENGSVTCSIEVDGVEVATNTSHGAFAIADCSGSV
jgi:hypothetical protein